MVIVSTPEPTSVADAHAAISRFQRLPAFASAASTGQPGWHRRRRRATFSKDSSPRAVISWVPSFRRFRPDAFDPTRTYLWRSALAGHFRSRIPRRGHRAEFGGWHEHWSANAIRHLRDHRAGFFAAVAARWAIAALPAAVVTC